MINLEILAQLNQQTDCYHYYLFKWIDKIDKSIIPR